MPLAARKEWIHEIDTKLFILLEYIGLGLKLSDRVAVFLMQENKTTANVERGDYILHRTVYGVYKAEVESYGHDTIKGLLMQAALLFNTLPEDKKINDSFDDFMTFALALMKYENIYEGGNDE